MQTFFIDYPYLKKYLRYLFIGILLSLIGIVLYHLSVVVYNPDTFWKINLGDILSVICPLFALLFAGYTIIITRNHKRYDFLSEIDKAMINDPCLWAIYDHKKANYPLAETKLTEEQWKGKKEAYCYLILNSFEAMFSKPRFLTPRRHVWEAYMIHLIVHSTEFKDIVRKAISGYIYGKEFQRSMCRYLDVAQEIEPHWRDEQSNKITREEYNRTAKRILKRYGYYS